MEADLESLDAKTACFKQQKSLTQVDGDDFDALEETQRQLHRSFFRPAAPSLARHQSLPVKPQRPQDMTPRRLTPAPQPESEQVIQGTQSGQRKPKGRIGALLKNAESDVVHETPAAEPTRREAGDASTPMPALKRLLSSTASEDLPSLGAATKKKKKKKKRRVSEPKARPEEEQIFKGLSFFYVPDNDIAPARRLRINKAKEFGATWTRNVLAATHVVAEKNLEYKDVERVLPRAGSCCGMPMVVNEDYPIDCIQFRSILDGGQKKYQLSGQPTTAELEGKPNEPPPPSSQESAKSLQLKPPPHHGRRKGDHVPPKGTPSQTGESSQASVLVESQPVVLDLDDVVVESPKNVSLDGGQEQQSRLNRAQSEIQKQDELSEYISMMQEFKHLPLDDEEGDDTHSVMGQSEAQSDIERSGSENESARRRKPPRKTRPTQKAIAFEDRFSCNQAGERNVNAENPNARTIEVLQSMNDYYGRINDHWRTIAYRKAISTLKRQDVKITTEEEAFRLPSIGRRLAQKIEEIVTTNKLKRLEYAQDEATDPSLQLFLKIYGVGNRQAEQWIAQGMRTLDDVRQKAKLTPNQIMGIEHYNDLNTRIPRREVTALGEVVKTAAARIDPEAQLIIGGSYRRGAESSHDIDFIVTKANTRCSAELRRFLDDLVRQLETDKFLVARLASSRTAGDGSKWHGCCVLPLIKGFNDGDGDNYRPTWRRIDFLLVPESEMGAALLYFTGNDIFNRSMRLLASKKGFRLNQRGLYKNVLRGADRAKVTEVELVEGRDERRIFEILGVKWREPHERWC